VVVVVVVVLLLLLLFMMNSFSKTQAAAWQVWWGHAPGSPRIGGGLGETEKGTYFYAPISRPPRSGRP
jgi:hypothetical protein